MKYKHIIFDVDGTLLDTSRNILQSLKDALAETDGIHREIDELRFVLGCTSLVSLAQLKVRNASETLGLWLENEARYVHLIRLFDGIEPLLEKLSESGYRLGIVTSRTHEELELVLSAAPIQNYFSVIICSDDVDSPKPAPDPILKYQNLTHARTEEILFCRRHSAGYEVCRCCRSRFALAVWGPMTTPFSQGTNAQNTFPHPRTLWHSCSPGSDRRCSREAFSRFYTPKY